MSQEIIPKHESIIIIDCGSQYTQLIARRVRQLGSHAYVVPHFSTYRDILEQANPIGLILSGGPQSIYEANININPCIFESKLPVLGICFGQQYLANHFGGKVDKSERGEYGGTSIDQIADSELFKDLIQSETDQQVWMSHGDSIAELPPGFIATSQSVNCPVTSMENKEKRIFGLQFHPEVSHTNIGKALLKNFVTSICSSKSDYDPIQSLDSRIVKVRKTIGQDHVILGLSGGVDSSVSAMLLHRAIGHRLHAVFIDNGMMRKDEAIHIKKMMKDAKINLYQVDAAKLFLRRLDGITNPEKKRKIIGKTFIEVFEMEAEKFASVKWLAQGTIYPDIIESARVSDAAQIIKSHHNVGGLPDVMNLKLIEPLRDLFKDEVRAIGKELGLPPYLINRHPFPGPGLAVRCLDELTKENLDLLREADAIFLDILNKWDWYNKTSQAFAVLLPCYSTGVVGDKRRYERVIALRSIDTTDFMTGQWSRLPYDLLQEASSRIINELEGVSRVVYDISSKPPATIEWE